MYHLVQGGQPERKRRKEAIVEYRTSIEIDAPAEKVWAVLADVERWPEWTKSMQRVDLVEGSELQRGTKVRIKQPRLPAMVWEVTELEPDRDFTWQATSGGVTSIGSHRLSVTPANRVVADLSFRQTGMLASLVGLFTSGVTRRYAQMEAEGLKRRSETP
jgi:uncharacterized membrane protein